MKVLLSGTSLYVQTPNFRTGYDKVFRLALQPSGPVDHLGERTILSSTSSANQFGANYAASPLIMSYGGEESPVIWADNGPIGGNHKIGDVPTILDYYLAVVLDGTTVPRQGVYYSGSSLMVYEKYKIRNAAGAEPVIQRSIRRTFSNNHWYDYVDTIWCMRPFLLSWFSGLQTQRPNVQPGQTLRLRVPGARLLDWGSPSGVDITSLSTELLFTRDLWLKPNNPPQRFENIIYTGGAPQFTSLQMFTPGQARGEIAVAYMRSVPGKSYPRGVEFPAPRRLSPGESYSIRGSAGMYNGH